jgi:hypothetical protein
MGIEEILPSPRTSWVVRYYYDAGGRKKKRFRPRELAKDFEPRIRVAVSDGTYIDPSLAKSGSASTPPESSRTPTSSRPRDRCTRAS